MNKNKLLLYCWYFLILVAKTSSAQAPVIEWAKCYGGTDKDIAYSIEIVPNGYIIIGYTSSYDGDISNNHGDPDGSLMLIDSIGNLVWERTCGGTFIDMPFAAVQTFDSGYVVFGTSNSSDGDGGGFHGNGTYDDAWVLRLDSSRTRLWRKGYGGTDQESAFKCNIEQTKDSGFIFTAAVNSSNGDVIGHHSCAGCGFDYWVVKINSAGVLQWQKCLGGSLDDYPYKVHQTFNNGFIVCGYAFSLDGDLNGSHGLFEAFVVKLDSAGQIEWKKVLGGSASEGFSQIRQTPDSGYIGIGWTSSNDGDVSGNHGGEDIWIVKLDKSGNLIWQKCNGTAATEFARDFDFTSDGGFVIAYQGDITTDFAIMKTDSAGNVEWQKFVGGSEYEDAESIKQTADGGYIIAGSASSDDGDVSGRHGNVYCHGLGWHCEDYWVVKLSPPNVGLNSPSNSFSDFSAGFNRSSGDLVINFSANKEEHIEIQLLDITGRFIKQMPTGAIPGLNKLKIPTGKISQGIYLVRLSATGGSVTKRVISY